MMKTLFIDQELLAVSGIGLAASDYARGWRAASSGSARPATCDKGAGFISEDEVSKAQSN
jgi:hypothetical protein